MAAELVYVGCKLPTGLLIELGQKLVPNEADDRRDRAYNVLNNGVLTRFHGSQQSGNVEGFGITPVDKASFDEWFAKNAEFAPVKAGLLWAEPTYQKARDHALMLAGFGAESEFLTGAKFEDPMGDGSIKPDEDKMKDVVKGKAG